MKLDHKCVLSSCTLSSNNLKSIEILNREITTVITKDDFEINYEVVDPDEMMMNLCHSVVVVEPPIAADDEFVMRIKFSVDYRVYESEPQTFYTRYTQYDTSCDWLIRVSMIQKKYYWEIKRYNDNFKLDSITIAEAIKPLVKANPSIKIKSIIAEVQSKFNYIISYCKTWLAK
ncbi:hypothetical protein Ahy_B09g098414 [Arachis hypogaea]|uniref:Transposase MuDR plant domain-containing protein n=1 Tax=Arachis hypogaea TaxID=3818 RepID=A0A444XR60_ARAHY|nr:hypothetical protein Ahy_B09g098414 [Arachis hypogaea]